MQVQGEDDRSEDTETHDGQTDRYPSLVKHRATERDERWEREDKQTAKVTRRSSRCSTPARGDGSGIGEVHGGTCLKMHPRSVTRAEKEDRNAISLSFNSTHSTPPALITDNSTCPVIVMVTDSVPCPAGSAQRTDV